MGMGVETTMNAVAITAMIAVAETGALAGMESGAVRTVRGMNASTSMAAESSKAAAGKGHFR